MSDAVGEIDGANGGAAALDTNNDNIRGRATQSANNEKTDNISSDKTTQATATAPKPCASTRGVRKRPTNKRNPSTYTKKKKHENCKKGAQIKIRRDNLFHILTSDK